MKIVIPQNGRNHSDFHPKMAVLGFELRLPCCNTPLRWIRSNVMSKMINVCNGILNILNGEFVYTAPFLLGKSFHSGML